MIRLHESTHRSVLMSQQEDTCHYIHRVLLRSAHTSTHLVLHWVQHKAPSWLDHPQPYAVNGCHSDNVAIPEHTETIKEDCIHTYLTYIHTYIHTNTHVHTHTHTHKRAHAHTIIPHISNITVYKA